MNVPFLDFARLAARDREEMRTAFARVHDSGWYVLGPEVEAFESAFAVFAGAPHAVGCASGTDAITLALRALGIGPGDDVLTVSMTCAPTATGIVNAGARPVFVDVDPASLTMDPDRLADALTPRTKAVVPVHLYGRPAPMEAIAAFARSHALALVEDCAQAHGARLAGRSVGMFGDAGAWSFYPTKNLGALGDAGLVTARDAAVAGRLRRLRMYGYETRNDAAESGFNSRLDELQAALLRSRLSRLLERNARRAALAARYDAALTGLPGLAIPPPPLPGSEPCHHLYVVRTASREALREKLRAREIGTDVHYPVAVHQQAAFANFTRGPLPVTESAVAEVLSLPLHPELSDEEVEGVAAAVREETLSSRASRTSRRSARRPSRSR
ncbi:MAG: DegT/DnrJ/EryC1/StrS family aminotransferase [Thermoanaerobaculia bacterium]